MARRRDNPIRRRTRAPKLATEPVADPTLDQASAPAARTAAGPRRRRRPFAVHLLDVGPEEYGDAVLCQFGETTILIDGAHPGDDGIKLTGHPAIPDQLGQLLDQARPPYPLSLLVVTHAHRDHIGCLPGLVERDLIRPEWALVADPDLGWGVVQDAAAGAAAPGVAGDDRARQMVAALREEPLPVGADDAAIGTLVADALTLEATYRIMLDRLREGGTTLVRYGRDGVAALLERFAPVGLEILGPNRIHLAACAEQIARGQDAVGRLVAAARAADAAASPVDLYRNLLGGLDALDATTRPGPAINNQSIVLRLAFGGHAFLFTGDMQLAVPEVPGLEPHMRGIREAIRTGAPYTFCKIPHHASRQAFDASVLALLGDTPRFGISTGKGSLDHPDPDVLALLRDTPATVEWTRTDRNSLVSLRFDGDRPWFDLSTGKLNDVATTGRRHEIKEEPKRLLQTLVDAYIQWPEPFRGRSGDGVITIYHPGLKRSNLISDWEHINTLKDHDFLSLDQNMPGQWDIWISPRVLEEYARQGTERQSIEAPAPSASTARPGAPSRSNSIREPVPAFIAYARPDYRHRNTLGIHLSSLMRQGQILAWHDRKLVAGQEWEDTINEHLESAKVILLLISPDFFASDYAYGKELRRALERHETGEAVVIPILVRPTLYKGEQFSKLQMLPENAKAVTAWSNRDAAWVSVVAGINAAIEKLRDRKRSLAPSPPPAARSPGAPTPGGGAVSMPGSSHGQHARGRRRRPASSAPAGGAGEQDAAGWRCDVGHGASGGVVRDRLPGAIRVRVS